MQQTPPPRLWIVHRPENDRALVIRRGPSKQVAFFGWNRKTDRIELGQWLKGKVYPRRCDLSPNGKYIIYFAHNGKWKSESQGSWTAVSRFPYLKALDFWPKGDAWNGGGMFLSDKKYLLYERFPHIQKNFSGQFEVKRGVPESTIQNNECLGIYIPKLMRDGWTLEDTIRIPVEKTSPYHKPEDLQYHLMKYINKKISLKKIIHSTSTPPAGKGVYYEQHAIIGIDHEEIDFKSIQSMDYYNGRLFWPDQGKVFSAEVEKYFIKSAKLIHDFSDYTFEAIKAPY